MRILEAHATVGKTGMANHHIFPWSKLKGIQYAFSDTPTIFLVQYRHEISEQLTNPDLNHVKSRSSPLHLILAWIQTFRLVGDGS